MKHFTGYRVLFILLSAKLLLHLHINGQWSFHRDELLYLALGNRLDYSSKQVALFAWLDKRPGVVE